MKKYLLGAALFLSAATAFAAPPSEESLERLMQVQHVDKMRDEMFAKVPALTIAMVQKQHAGRAVGFGQTAAVF